MVAASRRFTEVDNHKTLVSVKLLDQHRVVKEVLGPAFDTETDPSVNVREGPYELTLRAWWVTKETESLCGYHMDRRTHLGPTADRL